MSTSFLLTLAVNTVLISYIGPVFTIKGCGNDSIIFDRQNCVEKDDDTASIISFASTSYFLALVAYLFYFFNFRDNVILAISFMTVVMESCYVYILSKHEYVEKWAAGYYFTFVAISLFSFFMIVYKLKIDWLLK